MSSLKRNKYATYALVAGAASIIIGGVAFYLFKTVKCKKATCRSKAACRQSSKASCQNGEENFEVSDQEKSKMANAAKAKGNSYFQSGKYEQAIKCYTEAIELLVPEDKDAAFSYANRAACHSNLQQYEAAIADCTQALRLNPRYAKAMSRRSRTYEAIGDLAAAAIDATCVCMIEEFKNNDNLQKAEDILRRIGDKKAQEYMKDKVPKFPSKFTIEEYFKSFPLCSLQVSGSLEELNERIQKGEDLGNSYLARGKVHIANQQYAEALEDFQQSVENDPKDVSDAYTWYGSMLYLRGQLDAATGAFTSAFKKNPKNSSALVKRALVSLEKMDFSAALNDLKLAESANSKDPSVYFHKAEFTMLNNDLTAAPALYQKAIQLDPRFHLAYIHKARVYLNQQSISNAENTLKALLKHSPKNVDALCAMAEMHLLSENYEKCISIFEEASKLDSSNPNIVMGMATICLMKNDVEEAEKLLKLALQEDPGLINARVQLANIYSSKSMYNEALEQFDEACSFARSYLECSSLITMKEGAIATMEASKRYPELVQSMKQQ